MLGLRTKKQISRWKQVRETQYAVGVAGVIFSTSTGGVWTFNVEERLTLSSPPINIRLNEGMHIGSNMLQHVQPDNAAETYRE